MIYCIMNKDIIDNYNKILDTFILLFPDKKDKIPSKISEIDIMTICTNIVCKVNSGKNYKSLLLTNKCKLFKAIKLSFIPKVKMELVLLIDKNDSEERTKNINNMWIYIKNIFIAFEKLKDDIDNEYIDELLGHKKINYDRLENTILDNNTLTLLENFGVKKSQVSDLLNNINNADQTIGNDFIKNLIKEIKETPLYKNRTKQKISLKEIISNTTDLQDKYYKLLYSGDLNISSIVASLMSLMNNQDEYERIIKDLDIEDLIDTDNIIKDLTELLPPEYKSIINLLVSENKDGVPNNNFNPMDLIGNLLGENKKEIKELSEQQLKELEDFYSNLKI